MEINNNWIIDDKESQLKAIRDELLSIKETAQNFKMVAIAIYILMTLIAYQCYLLGVLQ